jgi:hypothetical protein
MMGLLAFLINNAAGAAKRTMQFGNVLIVLMGVYCDARPALLPLMHATLYIA